MASGCEHPVSYLPRLDPAWLASRPSTPFFCEENVWMRCADLAGDARVHAVVITNPHHAVAMWSQRAAVVDPIVWDYHVVVLVDDPSDRRGAIVLDVDCRAGSVLPLGDWLRASFRAGLRSDVQPHFRVVPARDYVDVLASDRSHMRDDDGHPTRPFPPWPPPHAERPGTLRRLIDLDDDIAGDVVDLGGLARRFGLDDVALPAFGESP